MHYKTKARKGLTPRERDVMEAVIRHKDFSQKFLCDHLGMSKGTLETHKWHIFKKLGARSGVEAVLVWLEVRI